MSMEQLKDQKKKIFIIDMFSNIAKGFSYSIDDEENPDLPRDNTKEIENMHKAFIDDSLVSNKKNKSKQSFKQKVASKAKVTKINDEDIEYEEEIDNKIREEG